jgi:hypothetical protein
MAWRMSVEATREGFKSEGSSAAVRKRRSRNLNVRVKRVVIGGCYTEKEREEKT